MGIHLGGKTKAHRKETELIVTGEFAEFGK